MTLIGHPFSMTRSSVRRFFKSDVGRTCINNLSNQNFIKRSQGRFHINISLILERRKNILLHLNCLDKKQKRSGSGFGGKIYKKTVTIPRNTSATSLPVACIIHTERLKSKHYAYSLLYAARRESI